MHLLSLSYSPPRLASIDTNVYPFTVPTIRSLQQLKFETPVTFLVGENGSGKSTLMEALAIAARSVTVGSAAAENDETLAAVRNLARQLRLVWRKRTQKGFYLRAEDYFGYVRRLNKMKADLEAEEREAAQEYAKAGRSKYAASLAQMPYRRELADLRGRYGEGGLDAHSHGESFLAFFQARFVPGGLYLLDEPEAPLSPIRQLALVAALQDMVAQDAQFIIATHSPIVMACPGATILNFDSVPVQSVSYDALEHVTFTKAFLTNPTLYLRHL